MYQGSTPLDARTRTRAGLSRRTARGGIGGSRPHRGQRLLDPERVSRNEVRAERIGTPHGDLRHEQHHPAGDDRIPDDISVVSFDNYTYLDYLDPAIPRVSQRISEMGALAVKILLQRIEGTGNDDAKIQLSPQLIVCNSVAHAHGEK